jgi:hypothetical protein
VLDPLIRYSLLQRVGGGGVARGDVAWSRSVASKRNTSLAGCGFDLRLRRMPADRRGEGKTAFSTVHDLAHPGGGKLVSSNSNRADECEEERS